MALALPNVLFSPNANLEATIALFELAKPLPATKELGQLVIIICNVGDEKLTASDG